MESPSSHSEHFAADALLVLAASRTRRERDASLPREDGAVKRRRRLPPQRDTDTTYDVDSIVGCFKRNEQIFFRVKWAIDKSVTSQRFEPLFADCPVLLTQYIETTAERGTRAQRSVCDQALDMIRAGELFEVTRA